jgi:DNA-binding FadR family transcriptional regulator
MDQGEGALTQLRAYLAQEGLKSDSKLPPERELCEKLGVSRGELRKALAVLESERMVWRHVGKGTFVGARPETELSKISEVAQQSNPAQVMRARLLIEPEIAAEAALHATFDDLAELRICLQRSREADTWRQYETWDNRLHRTIAEATHNTVLVALFDHLNAVRRTVVWGRLREGPSKPPANHHSFSEHDSIVSAIAERDSETAHGLMTGHLLHVQEGLLGRRKPPAAAADPESTISTSN